MSAKPSRPRQDPIPISITISGTGGAGKSSITLRLVRSQWTSSYDPTIEDSYSVTRIIDGQPYILSLTDTAGQEEYRSMWAASNLNSDAFLLVYDITSMASLDELEFYNDLVDMEGEQREEKNEALDKLHRKAEERERSRNNGYSRRKGDDMYEGYEKSLPPTPGFEKPTEKRLSKPVKILAGNKCDLSSNRQVPASVGLDWARKRRCGFMETSARNMVNIEETFALIVRRVMEARRVAEMYEVCGEEGGQNLEELAKGYERGGYDRWGRKIVGSGGEKLAGNGSMNATKPLSPLPGGIEKSYMDDRLGSSKWWDVRRWGLRCW